MKSIWFKMAGRATSIAGCHWSAYSQTSVLSQPKSTGLPSTADQWHPTKYYSLIFFPILFLASSISLAANESIPWHAPGWAYRAVVMVDTPGSAGVDAAAVRITHAGTAAPTANDYRIFDAEGKPVPYQITFHDPARDTLISFRCSPRLANGGIFTIYYGKAGAPVDPLRAIVDPAPGKGPPQRGPGIPGDEGGWIPRAGLVLVTMRRPKDAPNPLTIDDMARLIAASPALDGAGYRTNISDGLNPFGDSDYYISVYRGWLRVPATNTFGFCTCSNEASFSFMDGKELVNWPGQHTEERGMYGQKNIERPFDEGIHYVEYLQEEVLLYQMSFLGYKPPGAKSYVGIPKELFPQPHHAEVWRYETADGKRVVVPHITLLDSRWPPGRAEGQQTRYQLTADAGTEPMDLSKWEVRWVTGDGQVLAGASVEHLYLRLGTYNLAMAAAGTEGQKVALKWPVNVFQIDHVVGGFKAGDLPAFAKLVKSDDLTKLPTPDLVEFARLQNEASDHAATQQAAQLAIARSDISADDLAEMHLLSATSSALGKSPTGGSSMTAAAAKEVAEHLRIAVEKETDPVQRVQILARFIRAVGIDQADTQTAEKLFAQAGQEYKKAGGRKMREAMREATVAIGDAHLFAKELDKATEDYHTAEAMDESPMPPQVKASKVGAFPEAIEQHLAHNQVEQAMLVARRWQHQVPSDQVNGAVFFYLGKLERLQSRPAAAIRPLQLAIELAQGAEFEAEARWLLALAYKDLGDEDGYKRTLTGLVKSGLDGPFRQQAIEALKAGAGK